MRLYYIAPMFRYDRPQAGRYRQHHQFGCEAIGDPSPVIDAEIIEIGLRYITALGLSDVTVRINSIGDPETEQATLTTSETTTQNTLTPSRKSTETGWGAHPLRLLDSQRARNPETQRRCSQISELPIRRRERTLGNITHTARRT